MNNDKGMPAGGNSRFRGYPARMSERQQLALILQMTSQDAQQSPGSNRSELNSNNLKINQQKASKKGWSKSEQGVQKKGDFHLRQVGANDYESNLKDLNVSGTEEPSSRVSNKINSKNINNSHQSPVNDDDDNQIDKVNEETDETTEYRLNNNPSTNYLEENIDNNILINQGNISVEESIIYCEMRKTPPQNKVDRSATGQSGSSPRVTLRLNQIRGVRDDKKNINSRQNVSGLSQGSMEGLKVSTPSSTSSIDSLSSGNGGGISGSGSSSSTTANLNNESNNSSSNQLTVNSGSSSSSSSISNNNNNNNSSGGGNISSSDNNDVYEFKNLKESTSVKENSSLANPAVLDKDKDGKSSASLSEATTSSTTTTTTTSTTTNNSQVVQGQNSNPTSTNSLVTSSVEIINTCINKNSSIINPTNDNLATTTTTTATATAITTLTAAINSPSSSSSSSKRTYEGDSNDDLDEENRKKKRKESEVVKDNKNGNTLGRQNVARAANNEKSENKTVSSVTSSFVEQNTKSGKQGLNAGGKNVGSSGSNVVNSTDRRSPNAISIPNSPKAANTAGLGSSSSKGDSVSTLSNSNNNSNNNCHFNAKTSNNSNEDNSMNNDSNVISKNDDDNKSAANSNSNTNTVSSNANSNSNTINNNSGNNSGDNFNNTSENDSDKRDKNLNNSDSSLNSGEGGNNISNTTVVTGESDDEDERSKNTDLAPKVPPLKIVIPQSTISEQEQGIRNGKNTSTRGHQLPYVVPISNNNDTNDKDQSLTASGKVSPTDTVTDNKSEDKKEFTNSNQNEERSMHHQRVLRSSHRSGNGNGNGSESGSGSGSAQSKDSTPFNSSNNYTNLSPLSAANSSDRSTNSSPQQQQQNQLAPPTSTSSATLPSQVPLPAQQQQQHHNSPTSESSNLESNSKTSTNNSSEVGNSNSTTAKTNANSEKSDKNSDNSGGKNSKDGNESSENVVSNSNTSSTNNSNSATPGTPAVELHPRKRKIKPNKEAQQAASTASTNESNETVNTGPEIHPHDQPITNCYQSILEIRKQIERRRKSLFPVQPKPPQGFRDYLMNRCTYVLAGNANKEPNINPPVTLHKTMKELYIDQEKERYRLRMQHVVEKEKLVLSVEQEILRVHGRAARALANQSLPFSACTILKDEEVYNVITPEQEEKDRNARSRYNGRLFLSWLQDVDDKWEKIKEAMLLRHHNEAESLHAVQRMDWEWKLKEIGLCEFKATPQIEDIHVPMVHVSDDFDLLPA